ncbi:hypothetical protein [Actinoplanes sp. CA-252034]|uniref:hypothetical protein n=1 Tax=Actinoplanes sp. CA-252034 TaxID=3239906 RepID=UPI003D996EA6
MTAAVGTGASRRSGRAAAGIRPARSGSPTVGFTDFALTEPRCFGLATEGFDLTTEGFGLATEGVGFAAEGFAAEGFAGTALRSVSCFGTGRAGTVPVVDFAAGRSGSGRTPSARAA